MAVESAGRDDCTETDSVRRLFRDRGRFGRTGRRPATSGRRLPGPRRPVDGHARREPPLPPPPSARRKPQLNRGARVTPPGRRTVAVPLSRRRGTPREARTASSSSSSPRTGGQAAHADPKAAPGVAPDRQSIFVRSRTVRLRPYNKIRACTYNNNNNITVRRRGPCVRDDGDPTTRGGRHMIFYYFRRTAAATLLWPRPVRGHLGPRPPPTISHYAWPRRAARFAVRARLSKPTRRRRALFRA